MSKILHSFTLHEQASELIKKRSKKNEMSDARHKLSEVV